MTWPLSKAAVEAGAVALWKSHEFDGAEFGLASADEQRTCIEEAVILLRAALAAWEPSDHQRRMAAALTGEPVSAASIGAAVRTEADE